MYLFAVGQFMLSFILRAKLAKNCELNLLRLGYRQHWLTTPTLVSTICFKFAYPLCFLSIMQIRNWRLFEVVLRILLSDDSKRVTLLRIGIDSNWGLIIVFLLKMKWVQLVIRGHILECKLCASGVTLLLLQVK